MRRLLWLVAVILAALWGAATSAQTPSPFPYWANSAGVVMTPLAGTPPEWRTEIGGGAAILPTYEGSNSYHLAPAPEIDIRYRDLAFISTGDGVGVNLWHGPNYRAGVAISYDAGREHNFATRLAGTGNVDPTPEAKLFAQAFFKPFGAALPLPIAVTGNVRQAAFGHQGMIGDFGIYMPVAGNKTYDIFVGPSVTFADREYMQSYFGVSAQHAAPHSIFPAYNAHGGVKDASFGVSADYRFTAHWAIHGDVAFERLMGSAGNSPLVQEKDQLGTAITVGYTF